MLSLPKHLARIVERLILLLHSRCFGKLSMTGNFSYFLYALAYCQLFSSP
jgi:hypothetical protein